ncbi:hypothetical protein ACHAWF_018935, partial [Thalassiosira exigua]
MRRGEVALRVARCGETDSMTGVAPAAAVDSVAADRRFSPLSSADDAFPFLGERAAIVASNRRTGTVALAVASARVEIPTRRRRRPRRLVRRRSRRRGRIRVGRRRARLLAVLPRGHEGLGGGSRSLRRRRLAAATAAHLHPIVVGGVVASASAADAVEAVPPATARALDRRPDLPRTIPSRGRRIRMDRWLPVERELALATSASSGGRRRPRRGGRRGPFGDRGLPPAEASFLPRRRRRPGLLRWWRSGPAAPGPRVAGGGASGFRIGRRRPLGRRNRRPRDAVGVFYLPPPSPRRLRRRPAGGDRKLRRRIELVLVLVLASLALPPSPPKPRSGSSPAPSRRTCSCPCPCPGSRPSVSGGRFRRDMGTSSRSPPSDPSPRLRRRRRPPPPRLGGESRPRVPAANGIRDPVDARRPSTGSGGRVEGSSSPPAPPALASPTPRSSSAPSRRGRAAFVLLAGGGVPVGLAPLRRRRFGGRLLGRSRVVAVREVLRVEDVAQVVEVQVFRVTYLEALPRVVGAVVVSAVVVVVVFVAVAVVVVVAVAVASAVVVDFLGARGALAVAPQDVRRVRRRPPSSLLPPSDEPAHVTRHPRRVGGVLVREAGFPRPIRDAAADAGEGVFVVVVVVSLVLLFFGGGGGRSVPTAVSHSPLPPRKRGAGRGDADVRATVVTFTTFVFLTRLAFLPHRHPPPAPAAAAVARSEARLPLLPPLAGEVARLEDPDQYEVGPLVLLLRPTVPLVPIHALVLDLRVAPPLPRAGRERPPQRGRAVDVDRISDPSLVLRPDRDEVSLQIQADVRLRRDVGANLRSDRRRDEQVGRVAEQVVQDPIVHRTVRIDASVDRGDGEWTDADEGSIGGDGAVRREAGERAGGEEGEDGPPPVVQDQAPVPSPRRRRRRTPKSPPRRRTCAIRPLREGGGGGGCASLPPSPPSSFSGVGINPDGMIVPSVSSSCGSGSGRGESNCDSPNHHRWESSPPTPSPPPPPSPPSPSPPHAEAKKAPGSNDAAWTRVASIHGSERKDAM